MLRYLDTDFPPVSYTHLDVYKRQLMDIANKSGGMVIGTGDLSELALGWATYNGDHMLSLIHI